MPPPRCLLGRTLNQGESLRSSSVTVTQGFTPSDKAVGHR